MGKRVLDTPCEACGHLVTETMVSISLNGKTWHGSCYAAVMQMFGTPFQCAVCEQMAPTIRFDKDVTTNDPVAPKKSFTVWVCGDCANRFQLSRVEFGSLSAFQCLFGKN